MSKTPQEKLSAEEVKTVCVLEDLKQSAKSKEPCGSAVALIAVQFSGSPSDFDAIIAAINASKGRVIDAEQESMEDWVAGLDVSDDEEAESEEECTDS